MALRPVRALIVPSPSCHRQALSDLLTSSNGLQWHIDWCATSDDAIVPLEREAHDVCLLAVDGPEFQAGALFAGTGPAAGRTPVVVLAEDARVEDAAFAAGAFDVLPREALTSPLLIRAVKAASRHARRLASLRETERTYREVMDSLPDTIFEMNLEGLVTFVNQSAFARWGYTREEFDRGISAWALLAPEDRQRAMENARRVFAGEKPRAEYAALRKDGTRFWIAITSAPVFRDGRVCGLRGLATDITSRKRQEQALRESEEKYRTLVEHAVYGIYRTTTDGHFSSVNPALARMLGYARGADLLGRDILDFYQDPSERARLIERYAKEERVEGVEVQWKRKDGSPITVRLTGRVVQTAEGAVEGFEMIVEDVSETKALEQQFRQAQKMEAVGRLAGGIAHDFNNLLTSMSAYTDLLYRQLEPNDPRRQHLDEVRKAADRATVLTRQLLTFSRKQVSRPKPVDVNVIIHDLLAMLRRLVGANITLVPAPGKNVGLVMADPGLIEQVVMNLALNACDAMPEGGLLIFETKAVVVEPERSGPSFPVPPGEYVLLAVADSGCGMDAEVRSHLFEPFFSTKEAGRGTGLGLAAVRGIVQQCGGHLFVESEPNHGSTFEVYLPKLAESAEAAVETSEPKELIGGSETILLAEDEDSVRAVTREVLTRLGYQVLEASNGSDALSLVSRFPDRIDLLLTDLVMPGMTGPELAKRLNMQRAWMPVLYMSGHTDDARARTPHHERSASFLAKPYTVEVLARAVRDALTQARFG